MGKVLLDAGPVVGGDGAGFGLGDRADDGERFGREFQDRAGFRPGFDSSILNVAPAKVAAQAYRGLMADQRAVLPGFGIKVVPLLLRLFPRGFILGAVGKFQLRQR